MFAHPCERSGDGGQSLTGDRQEGPNHLRVELGSGAARQFGLGRGDRVRDLVGPVGSHDVIRVGNCHDAAGRRNLVRL
jgi:hypothetical protein